jgi:uncharacterized membrane protein YeaQ/YmgE (transglycosylase-associated protein family)
VDRIIGFVVGSSPALSIPARTISDIMTAVLGIGGSFLATYLGQMLAGIEGAMPPGSSAVIGAIALLVIYGLVVKKDGGSSS